MDNSILIIIILAVALAVLAWFAVAGPGNRRRTLEPWTADSINLRASYNIAGVNMRGLTDGDCGLFKGVVRLDPGNQHDPGAVAVLRGDGRHVGFLSKEIAADLHADIEDHGGQVPCVLQIERCFDEDGRRYYYKGRVQILWPTA